MTNDTPLGSPYRRYRINFTGTKYVVRVRYRFWPFWIRMEDSPRCDSEAEAKVAAEKHSRYPKYL